MAGDSEGPVTRVQSIKRTTKSAPPKLEDPPKGVATPKSDPVVGEADTANVKGTPSAPPAPPQPAGVPPLAAQSLQVAAAPLAIPPEPKEEHPPELTEDVIE